MKTLQDGCISAYLFVQDEVEEVEAKLEASEQQARTKWQRVLTRLCTPVFLEALILTFLAGQPLQQLNSHTPWRHHRLVNYPELS